MFKAAIASWDPVDGWAEVKQLIQDLPGHVSPAHQIVKEEIHQDTDIYYVAYLLVRVAGMLDHNNMVKS